MRFNLLHPDEATLFAHLEATLDEAKRGQVSAHLRGCVRCQDSLRFLKRISDVTAASSNAAPRSVLGRALATREAGERRIVPTGDIDVRPTANRTRVALTRGAAAAAVLLVCYAAFGNPDDVAAVSASSTLEVLPAQPVAGSRMHLTYTASGEQFKDMAHLVVRARLRMPGDPMYGGSVPASRVLPVAVLTRESSGRFTGSFTLPGAITFASMVVEDSAARLLDDNGGRLWDVVVHDGSGKPLYDALDQRINDMMGRSWDEAYATAKRLATLYPERVDAWKTREFFERSLFGERAADSLTKSYGGRIATLIAAAKNRPSLTESEIGAIFYDARWKALGKRATGKDSAEFAYWLNRTLREHPKHLQLAQYYAFDFTPGERNDSDRMLDSLDRLFTRFAPLHGPARNLVNAGNQAASRSRRDDLYLLWQARDAGLVNNGDSTYRVALAMTRRPSLARQGVEALRRLLAQPAESVSSARGLREDSREYAARAVAARSRMQAAMGRALIADGKTREGLDALAAALGNGWDPVLFGSLRDGYSAAGDSAGVQAMRLRLSVDPRTHPDSAAAITSWGRARVGASRWDSLANAARHEMHERILARATVRPLRGAPMLMTSDKRQVALRDITRGKPAAVIFWSRSCGWAIDAMPEIRRVAQRLVKEGKNVVFVIDEAPSAEMSRYLATLQWTLPVHYDPRSSARNAFNNFGTPAYYVVDSAGRIRFDEVGEEAELIAQVDAVSLEGR